MPSDDDLRAAIRERASPLATDPVLDAVGDADVVLIGDASHGTAEFYRWRARITARLIEEREDAFVAVEGDWPDCYQVNDYVSGDGAASARETLAEFERWPTWLWANWEVAEYMDWLRDYNEQGGSVGFYGLDVYSLHDSLRVVLDYLEDVHPEAAERAREASQCFEPHREGRDYAESLRMVPESCEDEVVELLSDLRGRREAFEELDAEAFFDAEQNALVAEHAEEYYRTLVKGGESAWNVRDRHMMETLDRIREREGGTAIVWAHNTHVGDARATDMPTRGNLNLGQLAREAYGDDVAVVGTGTHRGAVVAADRWGEKREVMPVPEAEQRSWEALFHEAVGEDCVVSLHGDSDVLAAERGNRAIGVVYDPSREYGNYVPTELANRYDAFAFIDETEALHPIETGVEEAVEPETYPWGV